MLSIILGPQQPYTTLSTFPTLRAQIPCDVRGGGSRDPKVVRSRSGAWTPPNYRGCPGYDASSATASARANGSRKNAAVPAV